MREFTELLKFFVDPLVPLFQDRETGLLRIRHREWLRNAGRVNFRYHLADRIFTNQAFNECLPVHRPPQFKSTPTDSARSLRIVRGFGSVFVNWHLKNAGSGSFRPTLDSHGILLPYESAGLPAGFRHTRQ